MQKIETMKQWPSTTYPINIKSFLGLDGYFRFSSLASMLTIFTHKKVNFKLSDDSDKIFT